jgi:hypothetical protein
MAVHCFCYPRPGGAWITDVNIQHQRRRPWGFALAIIAGCYEDLAAGLGMMWIEMRRTGRKVPEHPALLDSEIPWVALCPTFHHGKLSVKS